MSESFSGACFCGAVEVEVSGQPGGASAQFRLTWLPVFEPGNASPPSNEWKLFGDNIEVAKRAREEAWVQGNMTDCWFPSYLNPRWASLSAVQQKAITGYINDIFDAANAASSHEDLSASLLSASMYALAWASVRCSRHRTGTCVQPLSLAASKRPWPAMICFFLLIRIGALKPNASML